MDKNRELEENKDDNGSVSSKTSKFSSGSKKTVNLNKQYTILQSQISEIPELSIDQENNTDAEDPNSPVNRNKKKSSSPKTRKEEQKNEDSFDFHVNTQQSYNFSQTTYHKDKTKFATFKNGKYELIKLIGQGMTSRVFMIRLTKDHN